MGALLEPCVSNAKGNFVSQREMLTAMAMELAMALAIAMAMTMAMAVAVAMARKCNGEGLRSCNVE